ncbi:MAG: Lrp/AsnC family transcriptional regulator [Trueperaceae bacterium]|nr:Lrp/AsnC family transcriptional regulator [Trueperaceae bacterium]
MALDPLDQRIIMALEDDGRRPYREIARDLDVAEATVRSRVQRMTQAGWIRISAVGDPVALGVPVNAITLVRTRVGRSNAVAEALTELPNVRFVGSSFGSADLIIQTLHPSVAALHEFVAERLPTEVEGIESTETFQLARVHKSSWDWRAWFEQDGATEPV